VGQDCILRAVGNRPRPTVLISAAVTGKIDVRRIGAASAAAGFQR
jgi:hypothetical protein